MYVANKPQRPVAKPAKPVLKPETIQGAMDKRPRLNANQRRASPGVAPKPPAAAPPPEPAWMALRRAGVAGTGSAAGNRAAAAGLPQAGPQINSFPMPTARPGAAASAPGAAMSVMPAEPKTPMDRGGPGSDIGYQPGGPFMGEPMPMDGDPAGVLYSAPVGAGMGPSGSQNPLFSANLPPEIMQRLQALQAGRGGAGAVGTGQGVPGDQTPGTPAALQATIADYYQPPAARGMRPAGQAFDRRMAY